MTMAPPMPVPSVTRTTSGSSCTAPKRHSAQPVAFASFSTTTGRPVRSATASRSGSLRQARCGANSTVDPDASTNPAAPIPTASTSCSDRSCSTRSPIVSRTADGSVLGCLGEPASQDSAVLVDHTGGDLGAADVDADGEWAGHGRQPSARAGEVGGADDARVVAQGGEPQLGDLAVLASREVLLEGLPHRVEQEVACVGDAAADRDHAGVEHGREGRNALAHPLAHVAEQVEAHRVALLGEPGDHLAGDRLDCHPRRRAGARPAGRRTRPEHGRRARGRGRSRTARSSRAGRTRTGGRRARSGGGRSRPRRRSRRAAPSPVDDAAAHTGADGDEQQVVGVRSGTEAVLAPGRGVGVVLDDDREVDELADVLGERLVDPVDVGREGHRGAVDVDEARRADADAAHLEVIRVPAPAAARPEWPPRTRSRRRRRASARCPRAGCGRRRHETRGDLRPTDVDTDAVRAPGGR